ncbi:MAG: phosphocholine cytidylyltransferase family protein [Acidobacteria bacterium]|nr:phosphocholine cytidylyltransferase family protein [Acidobacteriota bacterium]
MKAIILAAGQGRRLRPLTDRLPKCLISIGGKPILTHMLERIQRSGLIDVVVVAGFQADRIRQHVNQLPLSGLRVRFVINERFAETNNLYSLWLALQQVSGPVTILNGDDFFNGKILDMLQCDTADASAAVDCSRPLPSDAMRVILDGSRLTSLGKTIPDGLAAGNAIGLYRFSGRAIALLRSEIERWIQRGRINEFHVAAINALAPYVPIRAISTDGLTWGEVDDYRDLAAAPAKLAQILAEERCAELRVPAGPARAQCMEAFLAARGLQSMSAQYQRVHA